MLLLNLTIVFKCVAPCVKHAVQTYGTSEMKVHPEMEVYIARTTPALVTVRMKTKIFLQCPLLLHLDMAMAPS